MSWVVIVAQSDGDVNGVFGPFHSQDAANRFCDRVVAKCEVPSRLERLMESEQFPVVTVRACQEPRVMKAVRTLPGEAA